MKTSNKSVASPKRSYASPSKNYASESKNSTFSNSNYKSYVAKSQASPRKSPSKFSLSRLNESSNGNNLSNLK